MGFTWWFIRSDEVSIERYFKFIPTAFNPDLQYIRSPEIKMLEERLSQNESVQMSNNSELIRLRELEKDSSLNDMILVFNQCFKNSKYLKSPKSEELISRELIELAQRILDIRKQLLN